MIPFGTQHNEKSRGKSGYPQPKGNVLVVENEVLVAELLAEMLKDLNYRPIGPIHEFEEALEAANDDRIDLALLDLKLEENESYAVAEILRARDIPFMFVTGYERENILEPYRDCTVLKKPFDETELQVAISAAMDNR